MSIIQMLGFDMFPGAADASNMPIFRAGLTGTYYDQLLVHVGVQGNPPYNCGVSGLPQHRLGLGPTERNGLLIRKGTTGSPTGNSFSVRTPFIIAPPASVAYRARVAFTMRVLPEFNSASTTVPVMFLGNGSAQQMLNIIQLNPNGVVGGFAVQVFNTTVPNMVLVPGRDYHFEISIGHVANDITNWTGEILIDGEVVYSSPNAIVNGSNFATSGFTWMFGMAPISWPAASVFSVLYADIVTSDSQGDSFNGRLGPMMVLPNRATAVTPGKWEKEGNGGPVDTLTDRNDSTYYASPTDDTAMSVRVEPRASGYKPLVTEYVVRTGRDRDAGRALRVGVKSANGNVVAAEQQLTTTNVFGDFKLNRVVGVPATDLNAVDVSIRAVAP